MPRSIRLLNLLYDVHIFQPRTLAFVHFQLDAHFDTRDDTGALRLDV